MPTVFWKAANWLGLVDDERYGYESPQDEQLDTETDVEPDEPEDDTEPEPAPVTVLHPRAERESTRSDHKPERFVRSPSDIVAVYPRVIVAHSYDDAEHIGETYRSGVPVMMNLTGLPTDQARRVLDFNSGLVFATGGHLEKVAPRMFLLTPEGVEVSQAERDRVLSGQVRAA
jgi:cell division inhibitor SepF